MTKKENKMRVNVILSGELLNKIDSYADKMCISRSSAISVLCNQQFQQQDNFDTARELMSMMSKPEVVAMLKKEE